MIKQQLFFQNCSFQGRYYPPKLCDGTRLLVKHSRRNIIENMLLTQYAKEKLYLFPKYHKKYHLTTHLILGIFSFLLNYDSI
jgi:hypothetical protein